MATRTTATGASEPRERLLRTASDLFYREGITSVGVDRLVGAADVTRATFYRHFPSKEDLVEAYLASEDAYIRGMFAGVADIEDPKMRLELLIGGLAADIQSRHTRGCPFINASAEYPDAESPVRKTVASHRAWFRATLEQLVTDAGIPDPRERAGELVLLRDAAMVGGYLDGWPGVESAFTTAARRAAGLD
jgi:AcrR family transcriptional regulator